MDKDKVLNLLGLCQRAKLLVSGEMFTLEKIKSNKAKLVFLASDAGPNTSKRIRDKALYYHVDIIDSFNSEELSQAIGKKNRMALAIIDIGFVKKIKQL
jgi:ribosomal protein L7Ae-like RNA K-turn-binding protein